MGSGLIYSIIPRLLVSPGGVEGNPHSSAGRRGRAERAPWCCPVGNTAVGAGRGGRASLRGGVSRARRHVTLPPSLRGPVPAAGGCGGGQPRWAGEAAVGPERTVPQAAGMDNGARNKHG